LSHDPAALAISTLPLPDALPILNRPEQSAQVPSVASSAGPRGNLPLSQATAAGIRTDSTWARAGNAAFVNSQPSRSNRSPVLPEDRKSTRLNSSHQIISYAVFCL